MRHVIGHLCCLVVSLSIGLPTAMAQHVDGAEPTIESAPAPTEKDTSSEEPRPLPVPEPIRDLVNKTVEVVDDQVAVASFQAGVNIRTDLGSHPLRLDASVRVHDFDFLVVVDPMVIVDGQFDLDLLAAWRPMGFRWAVMAGWRTTSIELPDGPQYQQRVVIGSMADLPPVLDAIHASWGVEMATVLYRHGGGLPSESIGFESGRHFIDYVNFGMFLRVHFTTPLGDEG